MYSFKSKTNETRVKLRVNQVNTAHELLWIATYVECFKSSIDNNLWWKYYIYVNSKNFIKSSNKQTLGKFSHWLQKTWEQDHIGFLVVINKTCWKASHSSQGNEKYEHPKLQLIALNPCSPQLMMFSSLFTCPTIHR